MTRKDYVKLAAALHAERPIGVVKTDAERGIVDMFELVSKRIADVLAEDNPRFNRERFLEAAGVYSHTKNADGKEVRQ
ncbi:MAG: hypothetical protein KGL39_28230 [Patescibacteria group bacterium]|nr:hypothetical protein [Patescibacteria group bacterium]